MKAKTPAARPGPRTGIAGLTEKEKQVLDWVALGLPDKQVASESGLKLWAVRGRLRRIFRIRGVHSRAGATAAWCNQSSHIQVSVSGRAGTKA